MDDFPTVFCSSRSLEEEEEADNSCDHVGAFADGYAISGERPLTDNKRHRGHYDSDRRNRREIANSNERKRMQSINAGFQSLRSLVCPKTGEKLSKAAILKYAAEFINALMRDKQQLIADKRYLEQVLNGAEPSRRCHSSSVFSRLSPTSLPARKRWRDTESSSSDEGIGFASTDEVVSSSTSSSSSKAVISELRRQVDDLKQQLEKEKKLRLNVEMDRERLEQLQLPTPQQQQPLSCQRTMSSSSSSSFSSSASDTSSLDLALPPPPTTTISTTTCSPSKDFLHSSMWRRNLETIVEAIRHVEGDSGLFASPEPTQPERHGAATEPEPTRPEANRVMAPLTEIQVHPVWWPDLAGQSFLSSPDTIGILHPFHRPSLTVPSS